VTDPHTLDEERYRWGNVRTEDGHYVCDHCHARQPIYKSDYIMVIGSSRFEETGKVTCGNYRFCTYACLVKWAVRQ
jgi:hypothetical protein